MSAMNNDMKKIDISNPEETEVLSVLKEQASATLESELASHQLESDMGRAAYVASRLRLLKLIFVGGCARNWADRCPAGWSGSTQAGSSAACVPPEDYDGRCGRTLVADLGTIAKKEEFSWKCRASWPCRQSCRLDYGQCPQEWQSIGRLCLAPASYDNGICSPAIDFTGYSLEDKLQWSQLCNVKWPCQTGGVHGALDVTQPADGAVSNQGDVVRGSM